MTPEQEADLNTARYLAECGVPIFLARPDSSKSLEYALPESWQKTEPDPGVLDDWKPGWAVCAVMGHTVDAVDLDPRSGGVLPSEYTPRSYGRQSTPSGGTHDLVAPLNVGSRDSLFPGVDVKAGRADGTGRGCILIAPTERTSKETGERVPYTWEVRPDLEELMLIGRDDTGADLAAQVAFKNGEQVPTGDVDGYVGPSYSDLLPNQQAMARDYLHKKIEYWADTFADAEGWPEGHRDHKGRGWEALTKDFAWALASYAATPWVPLTEAEAEAKYRELVPQVIAQDPSCRGKWTGTLLDKAMSRPADLPPWTDFEDDVDQRTSAAFNLPRTADEYAVADWLIESGLSFKVVHSAGLGWLVWDETRWRPVPEDEIGKQVVHSVKMMNHRAQDAGLDKDLLKKMGQFKTESKTRALVSLVRKLTNTMDLFDTQPDLLNVANGVVDLRTGELLSHDPGYMFTKISPVDYDPNASSPDFDQVLEALDPEVRDYMQLRFGQAATGYPDPDSRMTVGVGGGSNGKTTLLTTVQNAMGDFYVMVPNKLIIEDRGSTHGTEKTVLMGARMGFIDETPEGRYLNVGVFKTLLGNKRMSARKIAKDTIEWDATHSLFLMTNHLPKVAENDDGTTRRFALVKFEKKFKADPSFAHRVMKSDGPVTRAALAWIVSGAKRWYALGMKCPMPDKVKQDTSEWLTNEDPTNEYIENRFILDPNSAVLVREVNEDLNEWLRGQGQSSWSNSLTATRLAQSDVFKKNNIRITMSDLTPKLRESLSVRSALVDDMVRTRVMRGVRWRVQGEMSSFDPTIPDTIEELL